MFSELPEIIVCAESGTVGEEQRETQWEGARQRQFRDARRSKPHQTRTLQARSVSAFAEHM